MHHARLPVGYEGVVVAAMLGAAHRPQYEAALSLLDCQGGDRLLEIGCGISPGAPVALGSGVAYTGVDLSPDIIRTMRVLFPQATWIAGDAQSMALPPADAVLSVNAVQWMDEPEGMLRGARAALGLGGRIVIGTPSDAALACHLIDGMHAPSKSEIVAWLSEAGFAVSDVRQQSFDATPYLLAKALAR